MVTSFQRLGITANFRPAFAQPPKTAQNSVTTYQVLELSGAAITSEFCNFVDNDREDRLEKPDTQQIDAELTALKERWQKACQAIADLICIVPQQPPSRLFKKALVIPQERLDYFFDTSRKPHCLRSIDTFQTNEIATAVLDSVKNSVGKKNINFRMGENKGKYFLLVQGDDIPPKLTDYLSDLRATALLAVAEPKCADIVAAICLPYDLAQPFNLLRYVAIKSLGELVSQALPVAVDVEGMVRTALAHYPKVSVSKGIYNDSSRLVIRGITDEVIDQFEREQMQFRLDHLVEKDKKPQVIAEQICLPVNANVVSYSQQEANVAGKNELFLHSELLTEDYAVLVQQQLSTVLGQNLLADIGVQVKSEDKAYRVILSGSGITAAVIIAVASEQSFMEEQVAFKESLEQEGIKKFGKKREPHPMQNHCRLLILNQ